MTASVLPSAQDGLRDEMIMGSFDGLMTAIGVTLGAAHAPTHLIAAVAVCVALTGAMSMGAGVLLEDSRNGWREAAAMGSATLVGTFIPIIPVLLFRPAVAFPLTAVLAVGLASVIAAARGGMRRDYLAAYGLLIVVAVPTVGVALAFGAA